MLGQGAARRGEERQGCQRNDNLEKSGLKQNGESTSETGACVNIHWASIPSRLKRATATTYEAANLELTQMITCVHFAGCITLYAQILDTEV